METDRPTFDLTRQPWIPVLFPDGSQTNMSLREVFAEAHQLREVYADTPVETVALLRLLLALVLRVENSHASRQAWYAVWERGHFDANAFDIYFDKWQDRFDLFQPEYPFYQDVRLASAKSKGKDEPLTAQPLEKTKMFAETNPPAVLFSHNYFGDNASVPFAKTARGLVAQQASVVSDGSTSEQLEGERFIPGRSPGVLMNRTIFWICGDNLFQALLLNAPPTGFGTMQTRGEDRPAWERGGDEPLTSQGKPSKRGKPHPPRQILGPSDYLTWQTRRICLFPEKDGVCKARMIQGEVMEQTPTDDPLMLYLPKGKKGLEAHAMEPERALWRDADTILQVARMEEKNQRLSPASFEWVLNEQDHLGSRRYLIGAFFVRNEPGNVAKVDFWRHERMPLPLTFLANPDLNADLRRALGYAEKLAEKSERRTSKLWNACRVFARLLLYPSKPLPAEPKKWSSGLDPKSKQPEESRALADSLDPESRYWPHLEAPFLTFLNALAEADQQEDAGEVIEALQTDWQKTVRRTARRAFRNTVHAYGISDRVLRAAAQAEQVLV